ncbi:hypothetical protein WJ96_07180 [Burkholderia ubonensis]|uniref:Uncharacterized protein n=1 Tax=Burkholderia ubonensis TaxID=101571 RepID=A0AAW3MTJ8_9BURK|nr:hypothetical protein [Burkholderia ubonensis]KVP75483.1 hypothetical protein WJ93_08975 [Burkholderia ubonensis]KVP98296.1 hypothetical protein WJ96_07180 [Burkholderia ubonensis]KVZ92994.1 hypothetical protein WL25_18840 [Burkholderia ubonensis]
MPLLKACLHVTCAEFLPEILAKGLEPRVGKLSEQLDEKPGVFMFPSWEDMTDANRLFGEAWPYDGDAALLCVDVAGLELETDCAYEVVSRQLIPPSRLVVLSPNDFDWGKGKEVFVAKGGRLAASDAHVALPTN